jgi:endonuclease/exonuclease/phosphatase family metal-dependent hydrolase
VAAELRLLSYNVRSLRDDAQAVATVIRACRPDVVCIQEAPRFLRWRAKCAAMARESGLVVVTGGRPAAAMLLLASLRVRVRSASNLLLTKRRGLHQRGVASATFDLDNARFAVASIHLDLIAHERRRHVDEILAHADGFAVPTILAGDLNEESTGSSWQALTARYRDAFAVAPVGDGMTYSARRPVKRIDGIFVGAGIEIAECVVPQVPGVERASDHRPVLAVLRLPLDDGPVV